MTKIERVYFECCDPERDVRESEWWVIHLDRPCVLENVALAERIAAKVRVRSVQARNFELLAIPDVPGNLFRDGLYMGRTFMYPNQSISIRLLKDKPLTVFDCDRVRTHDGHSAIAIGWIDIRVGV